MSIRFKRPQMTKRMIINIIILVTLIFIISPTLYEMISQAYMNYQGLCIKEKRYLTNEEKIAAIITYINGISHVTIKDKDGFYEQIPYKNVDDFIAHNPNCCTLGIENAKNAGEIAPPSFEDKIYGSYDNIGNIKFLLRYKDENNNKKSVPVEWSLIIRNCGTIRQMYQ